MQNGFSIQDGIIVKYTGKEINLVIPDGVVGIGRGAFSSCSMLNSVTIAESVEYIADYAFECCRNLRSVFIPGNVRSIGKWAFTHCRNLESVTFSEGIKSIGKAAFNYCDSLVQVSLPDSLTELGNDAFYSCAHLKSVRFGKNLAEIGEFAFFQCPELENLTLPDKLSYVGRSSFMRCPSLKAITVLGGLTKKLDDVFMDFNGIESVYFKDLRFDDIPEEYRNITAFRGFVLNYENDRPSEDTVLSYVDYFKKNLCGEIGFEFILEHKAIIDFAVDYSALTCEEADLLLSMLTDGGDIEARVKLIEYINSHGDPDELISVDRVPLAEILREWRFGENEDGTAELIMYVGDKDEIICPSEVVGKSVTRIGSRVFFRLQKIKSVVFPESVKSFGEGIFDVPFLFKDEIAFVYFKNRPIDAVPDKYKNIKTLRGFLCNYKEDNPSKKIIDSYAKYIKMNMYDIGLKYFALHRSFLSFAVEQSLLNAEEAQTVLALMPENRNAEMRAVLLDYIGNLKDQPDTLCMEFIPLGEILSEWEVSVNEDDTVTLVKYIGDRDPVICPERVGLRRVTRIGKDAFRSCDVTSVIIPEGITAIEDRAFFGCSGLKSIVIPKSVTELGAEVFCGCSGLESAAVPEGVTGIGKGVFSGCKSLESVVIPAGVTGIGEKAFSGCRSLKSVNIPKNTEYIGSGAFGGCASLTSVVIPKGVARIETGVFMNCSDLESVRLPDSVKEIGKSAFAYCKALKSVKLPEGVEKIGVSAFSNCKSLKSVRLPDSIKEIGEAAFAICESISSVRVPDGVTVLNKHVFSYCKSLASVRLPDSIKEIGEAAFELCENLEIITLPDGVTKIAGRAFYGCRSLASINIPDSVRFIGNNVCGGCCNLDVSTKIKIKKHIAEQ